MKSFDGFINHAVSLIILIVIELMLIYNLGIRSDDDVDLRLHRHITIFWCRRGTSSNVFSLTFCQGFSRQSGRVSHRTPFYALRGCCGGIHLAADVTQTTVFRRKPNCLLSFGHRRGLPFLTLKYTTNNQYHHGDEHNDTADDNQKHKILLFCQSPGAITFYDSVCFVGAQDALNTQQIVSLRI